MNGTPLITLLTFLPVVGAILVGLMPSTSVKPARVITLITSFVALLLTGILWMAFDSKSGGMQFEETHDWIVDLGIQYHVAVDGLSLLMILLVSLVVPLALLSIRRAEEQTPAYYALILLLQAGLYGTFTTLNFFHWFIYWELSIVPAFFLIKLWGGPGRNAAATQFFIYTMVGSVTMLLSFLALFWATRTFDFQKLTELAHNQELSNLINTKLTGWSGLSRHQLPLLIFAGVFLGLAVKVPLVPFHTWLPNAYAEAPTSTTMLLTGLMSKMGVYGFLRILLPIFPDPMRELMTPLLWLAVATIVLSASAAFAQKDLKRMLAYSSINHLGICLLGVFAAAQFTGKDSAWDNEKASVLNGVMLQMFNHGLTASLLFCFVGFLEERSGGLRGLESFGGLRKVAPVFCGLMGISLFASLGLPGLNGFIGEFLIFKGAFPLVTWATSLSVIGLLLTAIFLLTLVQKVFNGPLNEKWSAMPDLTHRERLLVIPFTVIFFLVGLNPELLLGKLNATVMLWVEQLKF